MISFHKKNGFILALLIFCSPVFIQAVEGQKKKVSKLNVALGSFLCVLSCVIAPPVTYVTAKEAGLPILANRLIGSNYFDVSQCRNLTLKKVLHSGFIAAASWITSGVLFVEGIKRLNDELNLFDKKLMDDANDEDARFLLKINRLLLSMADLLKSNGR